MNKRLRRQNDKLMMDSEKSLKNVMRSNLAIIADNIIMQIMAKESGLGYAQKPEAIKGIKTSGINQYKRDLLDLLTVIAYEAIVIANKEVPKAKIQLSEINYNQIQLSDNDEAKKLQKDKSKRFKTMFNALPPSVKRRIKLQQELLIKTQIADLEKAVFYKFENSIGVTDSAKQLKADLTEAAEDYILGNPVNAGSAVTAVRTINQSKADFFKKPEVDAEIWGKRFVNNFPINRTPICEELNGTIFRKDDPNLDRYTPPLHWNCRSGLEPILIGELTPEEEKKVKPVKIDPELEKTIQFEEAIKMWTEGEANAIRL